MDLEMPFANKSERKSDRRVPGGGEAADFQGVTAVKPGPFGKPKEEQEK